MSWLKDAYDTLTGHSDGAFGKFFKYAYPFNAGYIGRKAWHEGQKYVGKWIGQSNSAAVVNGLGSSGVYGPTGSIVGRY